MQADIARTQYNVDGTGTTVGVLSTSVNQYTAPGATVGGLAASYATWDLNGNDPVTVIQDDPNEPPTKAARCWRISTTSHPERTCSSPQPS